MIIQQGSRVKKKEGKMFVLLFIKKRRGPGVQSWGLTEFLISKCNVNNFSSKFLEGLLREGEEAQKPNGIVTLVAIIFPKNTTTKQNSRFTPAPVSKSHLPYQHSSVSHSPLFVLLLLLLYSLYSSTSPICFSLSVSLSLCYAQFQQYLYYQYYHTSLCFCLLLLFLPFPLNPPPVFSFFFFFPFQFVSLFQKVGHSIFLKQNFYQ